MQLFRNNTRRPISPMVTSYVTVVQYQSQESDMETMHRRESDFPSLTRMSCICVRGVFSFMQF